jgi:hypothetical protein
VKLQNKIQLDIIFVFSECSEHLVGTSGTLILAVIFLSRIKKKIHLKFSAIHPASRLWCTLDIMFVDISEILLWKHFYKQLLRCL